MTNIWPESMTIASKNKMPIKSTCNLSCNVVIYSWCFDAGFLICSKMMCFGRQFLTFGMTSESVEFLHLMNIKNKVMYVVSIERWICQKISDFFEVSIKYNGKRENKFIKLMKIPLPVVTWKERHLNKTSKKLCQNYISNFYGDSNACRH